MKRVLLACLLAQAAFAAEPPDLLFTNATVYTANDKQPTAEAIGVKGERIIFVGSSADAQQLVRPETRVIDLHGLPIFPGFTDAHCHIFGVGEREMTLNLEGTRTREAFLEKVKERATKTPANEWITGRGWIETFWNPPHFPTAADLDEVAPNNPVFLTRADGHAAVANSAAMKIAGVTAETPNPFGGNIVKAENGAPTGMFVDHAMELIARHVPPPTHEQKEKAFSLGAKREIGLGWCEVQNPGSDYDDVEIMRRAISRGEVKLRVYNAASGPGDAADRLLRDGAIADDHRFTMRTIKCYADGALGSRGAALLEKYSDAETSGYLVNKPEDLSRVFEEALRRGIQIQTHAIGDRANRLVLDLYEAAFKKIPPNERKGREPRWRIEHAQILSPQDIPRFAKLGVIPSMQPSHAISDFFFAPARLGKERLAGGYA
ncbi:MAG TPA: amidohydrolase, partial [Chthoniobacterales bacterium]